MCFQTQNPNKVLFRTAEMYNITVSVSAIEQCIDRSQMSTLHGASALQPYPPVDTSDSSECHEPSPQGCDSGLLCSLSKEIDGVLATYPVPGLSSATKTQDLALPSLWMRGMITKGDRNFICSFLCPILHPVGVKVKD